MSGRALLAAVAVLASLAAVPTAAADGPMPFAAQGGNGVLSLDGANRYVAVAANSGADTTLEIIRTKGGTVWDTVQLDGAWGIPIVSFSGNGEGLSADGGTLVLADVIRSYPHKLSRFLVLDIRSLQVRTGFFLRGDFEFDALSPDASRLYLIQHVNAVDQSRYVVRAYDLAAHRLLRGRVADRTQKSWVMQGYPQARATSADGRWVYTLYQNPGGYPFVHALDTVRGVAHCIGLPWHGGPNGFYNMRVSLRDHDRTLAVHWLSGRPWVAVDTATWRVSRDHRAGFPWPAVAGGTAAALAGLAAFLLRRRRRRCAALEEELSELLRHEEPELVA